MKLVFLALIAFILVDCNRVQLPSYYHPRFFNPIYRGMGYFGYPYHFADELHGAWFLPSENFDNDSVMLVYFSLKFDKIQTNCFRKKDKTSLNIDSGHEGRAGLKNHLVEPTGNEATPRFFLNNDASYAVVQRPQVFNWRTLIYTTSATKTIYTTINCFASSLFNGGNPSTCNRRRRDIEIQLDLLLADSQKSDVGNHFETNVPSPVQKIETTALADQSAFAAPNEPRTIDSSKLVDLDTAEFGFDRAKRFFGGVAATTITSWSFTTISVPNRVGATFLFNAGGACPIGNAAGQCLLGCLPRAINVHTFRGFSASNIIGNLLVIDIHIRHSA